MDLGAEDEGSTPGAHEEAADEDVAEMEDCDGTESAESKMEKLRLGTES